MPFSSVVTSALEAWIRGRLVDAWLAEREAAYGAFDEAEVERIAGRGRRRLCATEPIAHPRMRLLLDEGALIGIDRNDRRVAALVGLRRRAGAELVSVAPVVVQIWRDGSRQANLARALPMVDVLPVDLCAAQSAGVILRETGGSDVVDALLALAARPGDQILMSDPGDLTAILQAGRVSAAVVRV